MLTMDKIHYYPIKMEYYDKGAKLIKIANFNYQKQGALLVCQRSDDDHSFKRTRHHHCIVRCKV